MPVENDFYFLCSLPAFWDEELINHIKNGAEVEVPQLSFPLEARAYCVASKSTVDQRQ
jgi:hypothetical protein